MAIPALARDFKEFLKSLNLTISPACRNILRVQISRATTGSFGSVLGPRATYFVRG